VDGMELPASQTNHSFHLIDSTPSIKLRKNWFVCSSFN